MAGGAEDAPAQQIAGSPGRVLLVDDQPELRRLFQRTLTKAGHQVAVAENGRKAVALVADNTFDVVISDVRMPDMTGIELLQHLRGKGLRLPVIVITGHGDIPLAVEAMKCGALDFIEKPFAEESILRAVRAAEDRAKKIGRRSEEETEVASRLASLSERERQVLEGLVAGNANKVIAHELGISPRTVEVYRANVMTKMQARSLSDLIRMTLAVRRPD